MATPTRIPGDLNVAGGITCQRLTPPAGSIYNTHVADGAPGVYVAAQKVQHQVAASYKQQPGSNAAAATEDVYVHHGADGEVIDIKAVVTGQIPSGDRTCTIDVQKSTAGGAFATVLTGTITLDSVNVIRVVESGTLVTSGVEDLVDGDILRVIVTVGGSAGTHVQGFIVTITINKDPE